MEIMNNGPLTGIRILDVSTMIAAPYGTSLLGDLGAEVIKVEIPGTGDTLRSVGPWKGQEPLRWPGMSRNKKSITLDIRTEEGQELFKKLCSKTDLIVENFRPGTLEKWNLGYGVLKQINPRIILTRVSGYGQTGPYKDKAGFGTPGTAFSGYTYLQGYPDRPPVSPSFSLLDYVTGVYVAFASDGKWVVLVTSTDPTFNRLAETMGRMDMLKDPRYYTNSARLENNERVQEILSSWIKEQTQKELLDKLDAYGVPCNSINSIEDIFHDPQYQARENIVEIEHPRLGTIKIPGVVPKFSQTPGKIRHRAPELGEHNEEIFCKELGLTTAELAELQSKGIV